ncbi:hypothetical protein AB6A40_009472 [Gnathostoma spinigerum]|uniref:Protein FRA10AC1 n=1 Tax=Gnathostoma spinigerum TaxID=75299 RepID=A0ABD6ES39_9BILA
MFATKRNPDTHWDDLDSEFDVASEAERNEKKKKKCDLTTKERPGEVPFPGRSMARSEFDAEHGRFERRKLRLMTMDVYSRHKELMNIYRLSYSGATSLLQRDTSKDRTDYDVLRERHKFLWNDEELSNAASSWETRLAKKYYDKLFKEYAIADLSQYKKNKIAMRWRIDKEVRSGKGQFVCGNKRCSRADQLTSWEVNFGYFEDGVKKNALVKLRLCHDCSKMLNYHSQKRRASKTKHYVSKHQSVKKSRKHSRFELIHNFPMKI